MNRNETCKMLCHRILSEEQVDEFQWAIDHDYKINFIIDNLPGVYIANNATSVGFPIGYLKVIIIFFKYI